MEGQRCFSCQQPLFDLSRTDRRAFRRFCCGVLVHYVCLRNEDLVDCPFCSVSPSSLIWEPLKVPEESQSSSFVFAYDSEEEGEKSTLVPATQSANDTKCCGFCLEGQTDSRDPLLQTPCCRQMGHVSCLRQYCKMPDECYDRTELKMIKNRVGVPRCFVCRNSSELGHILPILLPKVTNRVTSVTEANRVLDAWCNMFSRHLDNQTRRLKHLLTVEEVTGWVMRQDGRTEYDSYPIRIRYMKVDRFREEVKKVTKRMIRKWAGLSQRAVKFTANTCNRFSLCGITEVALTFKVINSYHSLIECKDEGGSVRIEKVICPFSSKNFRGHFLGFEGVTETLNSTLVGWNNC